MINYCKGFGVSFLVHGVVLAAVLCFLPGDSTVEEDLPVVDFSTVIPGMSREGGALPGSGTRGESGETSTSARESAAAMERVFGPVFSPASFSDAVRKPVEPLASVADPAVKSARPPELRSKPNVRAFLKEKPAKAGTAAQVRPWAVRPGAGNSPQAGADGSSGGSDASKENGDGARQSPAQGYIATNFNHILVCIRRNLQYPDLARRQKLSGIAEFTFIIRRDGGVEDLRLQKSSGYSLLDEAAEKAIRQAAPFPCPPAPARLVVPIAFRMG